MMLTLILLAAGLGRSPAHVLSKHQFGRGSWRATQAELIERPIGIADDVFAQALLEKSGLKSRSGQIDSASPTETRMGVKAITSGAGPEVTIFFKRSDARKAGQVCRITRKHGGMTDEWLEAYDWCAAELGMQAFDRTRPFFVTVGEVPPKQP